MLALSTSWKSEHATTAEALIASLMRLDIGSIELEYRVTDVMFEKLRSPLKNSGLKVGSVHNFFPAPTHIKGLRPSGDIFSLADVDKEQRRLAVEWTTRTIETANELESRIVVLHCGWVDISAEMSTLHGYFRSGEIDGEATRLFLAEKQDALAEKKPRHMEALMFSLERLLRVAEKQGVVLGLENRYQYHELPGLDDFSTLFTEFAGGPLGYWHDTGHAHVSEVLGLMPPAELLDRYADRLVGTHLHDAVGLDDHRPPGSGDIDFEKLKSFLKPDTLQVLELRSGTPDRDVAEGIHHLRDLGYGAR